MNLPLNSTTGNRFMTVLVADDDPGDQLLMRRSFEKACVDCDLRFVNDGEEALDYLLRRGKYENPRSSPRPDVLLLDINMPKLDGRQVLGQVKTDPQLAAIPVVILTTSDWEFDVQACYELGCNSYLTKPVEVTDFIDLECAHGPYRLNLVVPPPAAAESPL